MPRPNGLSSNPAGRWVATKAQQTRRPANLSKNMRKKESPGFAGGDFEGHFYRMESLEMLADSLLVAGMTLSVLLVLVLLKSGRTLPRVLLSIILGACFSFLLYYYAFLHHSRTLASIAVFFGYGMGFLLGPLLLFYARSLVFPGRKLLKPLGIHLLPWFIYWVIFAIPLAISMYSQTLFSNWGQTIADFAEPANIIENIYLLLYCRLAYQFVRRLRRASLENYSSMHRRDLDWCIVLIRGISAIVFVDIILSVYEWIFPPTEIIWNIGLGVAMLLVAFLVLIGYKGIFQSQLFIPPHLLESQNTLQPVRESENNQPVSYHLNGNAREIEALKARLLEKMVGEKAYLNENLTLGDLSKRIGLSDKKLSELLNRHFQTTFYDFVNNYRIEEVKSKIADPNHKHLTLLGMALESGFQSKTSFNRIFKQKVGMSPSAYKKKLAESSSHELERVAS